MITFKQKGDFKNTETFFTKSRNIGSTYMTMLSKYAEEGKAALASATPTDSGETASSWDYIITIKSGRAKITWTNSNDANGIPVAVLIQYGHATRNGGYVQGRDYINPAIKPIFDKIANELWKGVTTI